MLIEVGACTREHHEPERKQGDQNADVQEDGQELGRGTIDDSFVLLSSVIATEDKDGGAGNAHQDRGEDNAPQAPAPKGDEKLQPLLPRGCSRANDQPHKS